MNPCAGGIHILNWIVICVTIKECTIVTMTYKNSTLIIWTITFMISNMILSNFLS